MKPAFVVVLLLTGTLPLPLFAKTKMISPDLRLPEIEIISSAEGLPESVSNASAARPKMPQAPNDLGRDYEAEMEVQGVSRRLSGELAAISQAAERGEMTGKQAEKISQERYQLATTQVQLLIARHASPEREIVRTRQMVQKDSNSEREDGSAVVALPFSSLQLNPTLTQYLRLAPSQARAIEEVLSNERRTLEPIMAELRATSKKLFFANQRGPNNGEDVHALAACQATILSQLMVADSRIQAKIYAILNGGQRKKLDRLKQADEVSVAGED
jgi:hypothetical protein